MFDSRRPVEGLAPDSIHIWRVERAGDGWGVPQLVRAASQDPPGEVGAGADEFGPLLDRQGNLYFYSFRTPLRAGSHYVVPADDPHRARRETDLPDPSAATFVGYATLSADGRTAVIEGRARGRSDTDLFVATRGADGTWSAARPLEAVNTTAGEGTPYLTSDGRTLLFGSTRSGASDLYAIELCAALGG